MTRQQQDAIESLSRGLGCCPETESMVTGSVKAYFSGRVCGIFWSREYVVSQDGAVAEIASRP